MQKITNAVALRNRVLAVFDELEEGKVDIAYASVVAKLNETVISGLKSEMQYAVITGQEPHIAFYEQSSHRLIEG